MKIGIIGGGSIGLLFAAYLSEQHSVTLYCRTKEQADIIKNEGVILVNSGASKTHHLHTAQSEEISSDYDLLIIAVKQYQLIGISKVLGKINENIPVIFLQNGMGHLDYITQLKYKTIMLGTVEHGALKITANEVEHTGGGVTRIAGYRGDSSVFQQIFASLQRGNFPFIFEPDYYSMLIQKLVINAAINPLTAILRVRNGDLVNNPYFLKLLNKVFDEIADTLNLENKESYYEQLIMVCNNTGCNYSSMLKDVLENRPTEIEGILGYILNKSNHDHSVPYLHFLYTAVKGLE